MSSQINPYSINANFPVAGQNNPSSGLRQNALATQNQFIETALELSDLQNKVIVSAPLSYGSNANINNCGGMPITNMNLYDFGYNVSSHGTVSSSATINFDYTLGYYHTVDIEGTGTTISVNPVNFPNLGYSEIIIGASTTAAPQYINLTSLASGGNIYTGVGITGYNSTSNVFTLVNSNSLYQITLGSIDGLNWVLSAKNNGGTATPYIAVNSRGSIGDTAGKIAYDNNYAYICTANYDGVTSIWKRAVLYSF